jgi:uncharacterized protein YbjT (DUF2867 family)
MDVFVTGAAGSVGRRLATLRTSHGDHVTSLYRRPEQSALVQPAGSSWSVVSAAESEAIGVT